MTGQALERHQAGAAPAVFNDREMKSIEWQARAITALDKRVEGNKEKGLALAITLYSLGLPVTITNAKKLHLIGDDVVESAQLLTGLLAMHGHEVRIVEESDERAVVRGRRHGVGEPYEVTYTADQARSSGAFDEWVEKWEESKNGKKYPVRHYLVFEGQANDATPEQWAQTLINRGQIKRMDAWHKYRSDMLVNRAVRRLAKRMGADSLMGVSTGEWTDEPAGIAPRPDDIVLDDEFGDPLDEDARPFVEEAAASADVRAGESRVPPGSEEADPEAELRNERTRIHVASGRIPDGTWRQLWAKAWREAGLPQAQQLAADQLEPARLLVRQYLALAALDGIGASAESARHVFVDSVTNGETESTKALTAEQFGAVMAAVNVEAERQAAEAAAAPPQDEEPEYGPDEEPF